MIDNVVDDVTSSGRLFHILAAPMGNTKMSMSMSKTFIGYRRRRMSRVRIGGADGRRNVRLSRMQQRTVLFSDVP